MTSFDRLAGWFSQNGAKTIVALSGGVDSAVVALAAKKALGNNAMAVTADYKTLAEEELATARKVAQEIGIKHLVIEYDELENPEFVKNDEMRSLPLQDGAGPAPRRRSKKGRRTAGCRRHQRRRPFRLSSGDPRPA
ncbi:7-cyano-7-deazaguanine synthase [Candidatus Nitrososphaera sp. FF02]|uniref:7-cyano-7-deazaguanine synthase n=1 Tax=Candidatus Nitrososphaera sp. FF02 TaxID=3398226 RepID=UPI0039E8BD03